MWSRTLMAGTIVAAATLVAAPAAQATFPGRDGRIAAGYVRETVCSIPPRITFTCGYQSRIVTFDAQTGGRRDLYTLSAMTKPRTAADGRRIVGKESRFPPQPGGGFERPGVLSAPAGGGARVTEAAPGDDGTLAPLAADEVSYGPDGQLLLTSADQRSVLVRDTPADRPRTVLGPLTGSAYVADAAWSPDGQTIAISVYNADGSRPNRVVGVSPDGGDERVLVAEPDDSRLLVQRLDWAPDSSRLLLHDFGGDLYVSVPGSTTATRLPTAVPGALEAVCSPSGTRIAVNAGDALYVGDADGSDMRQIAAVPQPGSAFSVAALDGIAWLPARR